MTMLKSRLYEEEMRKREAIKNANNASKKKIEWAARYAVMFSIRIK
jgi:peptide chain release factor 2